MPTEHMSCTYLHTEGRPSPMTQLANNMILQRPMHFPKSTRDVSRHLASFQDYHTILDQTFEDHFTPGGVPFRIAG